MYDFVNKKNNYNVLKIKDNLKNIQFFSPFLSRAATKMHTEGDSKTFPGSVTSAGRKQEEKESSSDT